MKRSTRLFLAAAFVAVFALAAWQLGTRTAGAPPAAGALGAPGAQAPARPLPVTVARAARQDVPVQLRLVGRSEAPATVALRSRMDGQILSVHFQPGATVRQGQAMFRLDQRLLEAQLAQAQASLARQVAELDLAKAERARQTELMRRGFVSRAQLDTLDAAVKTAEAMVNAERARVDVALTQLEHAVIAAPIDGVAGAILATPGNVVRANDTELVIINQVDPIQIGFSVPESQLHPIRQAAAGGPLRVDVHVPGERAVQPLVGELTFIDNQVDVTTGTIRLTALLPNADRQLTPGQFVEVSLQVGLLAGAVVVPAEALQVGPDGSYLWVVDGYGRADVRTVSTRDANRGVLAVLEGLAPGEVVVTDGHLRLVPGTPVEARAAAGWAVGPGESPGPAGTAAGPIENDVVDGIPRAGVTVP
jgi:membrane fusion protein, multidrug efflux system